MPFLSLVLVSLALSSLVLVDAAAAPSPTSSTGPVPIARARNGTYEGLYNAHFDQDQFLGVPYAQPPLDSLRFRSPVSLNSSWAGTTRQATTYSPICVGYGSDSNLIESSEDCLTLNIVRPVTNTTATATDSLLLPVAVWFYGGGFYGGGTSDPRYNLSRIVQKSVQAQKPFIGVSVNYRLSAFGFLWGREARLLGGDSNVGLRDQRLALRWLQENVAGFGGDPRKVTIWGESAGAISVGKHLLAYGGRDDGLFSGVIMESGGPLEKWPYAVADPDAYTDLLYKNLTDATGCTGSANSLECLRSLPFAKLNAALNITNTWIAGTGLGPFLTVTDDDLVQGYPSDQINQGRFVKVPILYGTNTDEGTAIGPAGVNTDVEWAAALGQGGPDNDTIRILSYLYPNIDNLGVPATYDSPLYDTPLGRQWKRIAAFFGDAVEHAPRRATAMAWANNNVTAYTYRFNVRPYGLPLSTGATHFQEVAWVFNNIDGAGYTAPPMGNNTAYMEVSTLMSRAWAAFIHDRDPNGHGLDGYPEWPVYDTTHGVGRNFVLDANITSYVEEDSWRGPGIAFISGVARSQFGH